MAINDRSLTDVAICLLDIFDIFCSFESSHRRAVAVVHHRWSPFGALEAAWEARCGDELGGCMGELPAVWLAGVVCAAELEAEFGDGKGDRGMGEGHREDEAGAPATATEGIFLFSPICTLRVAASQCTYSAALTSSVGCSMR